MEMVGNQVDAAQATQIASPPTQSFNHFTLSIGVAEILLAFGTTRIGISNSGAVQQGIEWIVTGSMSPITAAQLASALMQAVELYEKSFGKIPSDAKATIQISDASTTGPHK
ncbi:MAG: hypothetical protein WCC12_14935 [Anaerolineales bacterium]